MRNDQKMSCRPEMGNELIIKIKTRTNRSGEIYEVKYMAELEISTQLEKTETPPQKKSCQP